MRGLHLVALTPEAARAAVEGDFSGIDATVEGETREVMRDVAGAMTAFYDRTQPAAPWIGYIGRAEDGEAVGLASFKGGVSNGEVEISYFTFPAHEGRGCATAMAARLIDIAAASPERPRVIAHTLPQENASCTVLRRQGFVCEGSVQDPEDGEVWRWVEASVHPSIVGS